MEKQLPLSPQPAESLQVSREHAAIILRPSQLFNSTGKREAIIGATTRLAGLTKATPDVTTLLAYADNLEELPTEALVEAFEQAENTCQYLPTIPELRAMVGYHVTHLEEVEIDDAWAWVQNYIAKYGPEGNPYKQPKLTEEKRRSCERCSGSGFVQGPNGMKKCPCREASVEYPPAMPIAIEYALRQMANTARDAMKVIQEASGEYVHKQNKLRGQFNEAYKRGKLARKTTKEQ